jgi:hypothetical protein
LLSIITLHMKARTRNSLEGNAKPQNKRDKRMITFLITINIYSSHQKISNFGM